MSCHIELEMGNDMKLAKIFNFHQWNLSIAVLLALLLCFSPAGPAQAGPEPQGQENMRHFQLSNGLSLSLPDDWQSEGGRGAIILQAYHYVQPHDPEPALRLLIYRHPLLPPLNPQQMEQLQTRREELARRIEEILQARISRAEAGSSSALRALGECRSRFIRAGLLVSIACSWQQENGRRWQGQSVWLLSGQGGYHLAFYWQEGMGDYYAVALERVLASLELQEN
jgi:hypothetical protein